jgi:hypothetical protein
MGINLPAGTVAGEGSAATALTGGGGRRFRRGSSGAIIGSVTGAVTAVEKPGGAMNQRKWEDLLDKIEKMFGFTEHTTEEYPERRMTIETAVFDGASGRIKLERTRKPVVLDTRMSYSKRTGSDVVTEYLLSDDEYVDTVRFFRWDRLAREWKQIDLADIGR